MIILAVIIAVLVLLVIRHFTWQAQAWPKEGLTPPKFQGHRGYWKEGAQENTLFSFRAAKIRGLKMIEMDVRFSKDEQVVVYHDNDLKRLSKMENNVADLTVAELAKASEVCTLEEVFTSTDIPEFLNIELKSDRVWDGALEASVAALVRKHKVEKRILFSSFNPVSIYRLSKLLPDVPRALLASKEDDSSNRFYLKHLWLAPYINANILHLDYKFVSVAELEKWKKRKVPVAFWTVNEVDKAKELLSHGAVSIITDTLTEAILE